MEKFKVGDIAIIKNHRNIKKGKKVVILKVLPFDCYKVNTDGSSTDYYGCSYAHISELE